MSFQELAVESPDEAEGHCQISRWFSLPRLPGQEQSALLQCSVPLDFLLTHLAEGLSCPPACYSSLISSKPLASISAPNDLIDLYNREMITSLNIDLGPLGNQHHDEWCLCPLNQCKSPASNWLSTQPWMAATASKKWGLAIINVSMLLSILPVPGRHYPDHVHLICSRHSCP